MKSNKILMVINLTFNNEQCSPALAVVTNASTLLYASEIAYDEVYKMFPHFMREPSLKCCDDVNDVMVDVLDAVPSGNVLLGDAYEEDVAEDCIRGYIREHLEFHDLQCRSMAETDIAMNGQCHALAMRLNEMAGWPIWGAYKCDPSDEMQDGRLVHILVELPDGTLLDALGADTIENREADAATCGTPWEFVPIGGVEQLKSAILDDAKSIWADPKVEVIKHLANAIIKGRKAIS